MSDNPLIEILSERAMEKFGHQRAEKLRSEIEQLADELKKLYSAPVEPLDEP
jgi:hypothetical protein